MTIRILERRRAKKPRQATSGVRVPEGRTQEIGTDVIDDRAITDGQHDADSPHVGCLIVVFRTPVGLLGSAIVLLFFAVWFALETALALVAFPLAAVFADKAWVRESWLGAYPHSLRACAEDRFRSLRVVWDWVFNPTQSVDLNAEASTAAAAVETAPSSPGAGTSTAPGLNQPVPDTLGCVFFLIAVAAVIALIKGCLG